MMKGTMKFHGGKWKVCRRAKVVASGHKTDTMTLYMTTNISDTVAVADKSVDSNLWDLRPGHMCENGMKVLLSKGKLSELKSVEPDMCEGCILGTKKNVSFMTIGRTSKSGKLELIHRLVGTLPNCVPWRFAILITQAERYGFIF